MTKDRHKNVSAKKHFVTLNVYIFLINGPGTDNNELCHTKCRLPQGDLGKNTRRMIVMKLKSIDGTYTVPQKTSA